MATVVDDDGDAVAPPPAAYPAVVACAPAC